MSKEQFEKSYNERLFGSGFRKLVHESRYKWIAKRVKNIEVESVLELGCFDGKALDFFPELPKYYEGYDANWEKGLDLGKRKWENNQNFHFIESTRLEEFNPTQDDFDLSLSMETLEHLPDEDVPGYLNVLAEHTSGLCLITVPNEIGLFLLLKTLFKKVSGTETEEYSIKELFYGFLGRVDKVSRNPGGHKGFSHKKLIDQIKIKFEILEIQGLPYKFLTPVLNPTIGIVARRKK